MLLTDKRLGSRDLSLLIRHDLYREPLRIEPRQGDSSPGTAVQRVWIRSLGDRPPRDAYPPSELRVDEGEKTDVEWKALGTKDIRIPLWHLLRDQKESDKHPWGVGR